MQYNYAGPTSLVPCHYPPDYITDAELSGPLGHLVDMFSHLPRRTVRQVYVQARLDVQTATDRLLSINTRTDLDDPYTGHVQQPRQSPLHLSTAADTGGEYCGYFASPAGLDSTQLAITQQDLGARHVAKPFQRVPAQPGALAPSAALLPGTAQEAPLGVFVRSRAFWPDWSNACLPDKQQHRSFVQTAVSQIQPPAHFGPVSGAPLQADTATIETLTGPLPPTPPNTGLVLPAGPDTAPVGVISPGPDKVKLSLPMYKPPPRPYQPPRPPSAEQRKAPEEADSPSEEQSLEFLQGVSQDMEAAVVRDVYFQANKDVDLALCHLMQMKVHSSPAQAVCCLQMVACCQRCCCCCCHRSFCKTWWLISADASRMRQAWAPCPACRTRPWRLRMAQNGTLSCPPRPVPPPTHAQLRPSASWTSLTTPSRQAPACLPAAAHSGLSPTLLPCITTRRMCF